ncbi:MAG TPA: hypothetical protein VJV74_07225 [Terriglobia bacterium]|nr:hypothetical protein [Terriglobia bacterium]
MDPQDPSGGKRTSNPTRETRRYLCPHCGHHTLEFTRAPHRDGSGLTTKIHCWACGGGLDTVHAASGIPRWRLLNWPPPDELGPQVRSEPQTVLPRINLSIGAVYGHAAVLWTQEHEHALMWLLARGLSEGMIRKAKLGYDQTANAITIPVWDDGKLANLRRRLLSGQPKIAGLPGHGSQLYPHVPKNGDPILVAGEFDALIGRQHGLPTVSTTCGACLPEHLVPQLAGRSVAVMYDVGEELAAQKTVQRLLAAGGTAWRVRLSLLGLPEKADLNDALLTGIGAEDVRTLVAEERQRAARKRGRRKPCA